MTSRHTLTDAAAKRIRTAMGESLGNSKFTFRVFAQILKDEGYRLSIISDLVNWLWDKGDVGLLAAIARECSREAISAREALSAVKYAQFLVTSYDD